MLRRGTGLPNPSCAIKFSGANEFPCLLTTSRIGNLNLILPGCSLLLLYVMTIHTYIHTYIHTGFRNKYH